MNTRKHTHLSSITTILLFIFVTVTQAQDWPQWRGANRQAVVTQENLQLDWSASKPAVAWTFRKAGTGYSSPAIVGTTLYCQGATDEQGFAFALDTQTGELKWKQTLGKESVQDREIGPRGTITVDGDKLYLIRGIGQIHCLSAADGNILWQKDFTTDFNGKIMSRWGFSESPLVDGNLVICTPGGVDGTVVALDKNTGNLIWRTTAWTDEAGYSSPIVAEVDGVRQYIQQAAKSVAGISAKEGKILWKIEIPAYKTAVIPTPVYHDHTVYVTSGYNAGCTYIRLVKQGDAFTADTLYANKNMVNHHGGVVLIDGHIYGYSDPHGWVCQELKSGKSVWKKRDKEAGKGAVLAVNDRLLLLSERGGLLTIIDASPDGWKEYGRMEFPERTQIKTIDNMIWAHPVIANGKLYLRDHDLLFCYELGEE